MDNKRIGSIGEELAVSYLRKEGYKILDRNYIPQIISGPRVGEIDIVALKGKIVVFVEVKTSLEGSLIEPEERVNITKQKKLVKSAETYILEKDLPPDQQWQIDIISLIINQSGKKVNMKHLKNTICQE